MLSTDHVAHVRQCNFYGVTPLNDHDIMKLHAERLSGLDAAFSVASDLACGFAWREAINAYKRAA